ncbi:hypothetical protein CPB83DRAFT_804460 [Crepidotus variabilis]|uniref:DUF1996 domain-containing protein n=1 Tax=Crepidotus variabilis TaxID=179855 RepID=A0A9P6ETD9_9AGAR|nr:hypothetical protein CPB83DRAFT_804460 [Crepidotus variabilis]
MLPLSPAFTLLAVSLFFGTANAWFRLACTLPLVRERIDPIVSPGVAPANHVHSVHGGSNFAPSSTYDSLRQSSCSSCLITQDKSNYWFPTLYFQDPKTKQFEVVPNGGLLVYYQNRGTLDKINGGPGLKAFPAGFRMISGNVKSRSQKYPPNQGTQAELAERAVKYICLRYSAGKADYEGYGFPTTDCEAGFQARIHMPACWDGKNVDSADHTSHVAYLSIIDNGSCPPTHPVGLMKLFYEITWDVTTFASRWKAGTDKWPFVYADGDPTGFSAHGDFQNGWDINVLQNAIDQCNNPNDQTGNGITEACKYFVMQSAADATKCRINPHVSESTNGTLARLPGCNPIQAGPSDATLYSDSNCPAH